MRIHCYGCQALRTVQKAGILVGRHDGNKGAEFGNTIGNLGCSLTVGTGKIPGNGYLRWTLLVDQVKFACRLEPRFHHDYSASLTDVPEIEHAGPGKWVVLWTHVEMMRRRINVQDPEDHRKGRMMYWECTPYSLN